MITCKHVFIDKRITIYNEYYMYQKIITLANHKGGVGKSTSTASIGACMALMGKKVLLIDLDGQANLTLYFIPDEDSIEVSIFDSLVNGVPLPVVNVKENLDIVPSSLEMASAEISMTNHESSCLVGYLNLLRTNMTIYSLIVLHHWAS